MPIFIVNTNKGVGVGTIPILRQQKNWVGRFGKWTFLLTFSTVQVYAYIMNGWMGGWVRKSPKFADVI